MRVRKKGDDADADHEVEPHAETCRAKPLLWAACSLVPPVARASSASNCARSPCGGGSGKFQKIRKV
jgi:hypothetical protein